MSVNDLADRPPRPLRDNEAIDLGGERVRRTETPHVPHGWDAGLFVEEITGTLLCGHWRICDPRTARIVGTDAVLGAI